MSDSNVKAFSPFLNIHNTAETAIDCIIESLPQEVEEAFNFEHTDLVMFTGDGYPRKYYVPASMCIFFTGPIPEVSGDEQ